MLPPDLFHSLSASKSIFIFLHSNYLCDTNLRQHLFLRTLKSYSSFKLLENLDNSFTQDQPWSFIANPSVPILSLDSVRNYKQPMSFCWWKKADRLSGTAGNYGMSNCFIPAVSRSALGSQKEMHGQQIPELHFSGQVFEEKEQSQFLYFWINCLVFSQCREIELLSWKVSDFYLFRQCLLKFFLFVFQFYCLADKVFGGQEG